MAHLPSRGGQQDLKPKAELSGTKRGSAFLMLLEQLEEPLMSFRLGNGGEPYGVEIPAFEGTGQAKARPARPAIEMQ